MAWSLMATPMVSPDDFNLAKELEEFEINEYLGSEDWPKHRCKRLTRALIQERKQVVCRKATVTQSQ